MHFTGGALVARALADEGISLTFGIPGTHNIELYDALAESEVVRPVLVTDEQSASFMADGYWRASGRLACVSVVPGAGLTHALSGIAEAFMDNIPMLVLGCGIRRDIPKAYQLHDIDQLAVVRPVTKAAFRVERGEDLYPEIRRACALARSGAPGPVMVEVPVNLYLHQYEVREGGFQAPPRSAIPTGADALAAVAALLNDAAARPFLYVGLGAARAAAELLLLAERLEAPVATTFQGKGVFPESHPLFLWNGFGAAAPSFARAVAGGRRVTLAVACRFSEVGTGSYGLEPPGPLIHVDIDPGVPGRNYPVQQAVTADAASFIGGLLSLVTQRPTDAALRRAIASGHERVWREWRSQQSERVTPARLLRDVQDAFGPETIFTTDSGNGTFLAMECLRLERSGKFLAPVDYSCMGYAVPAAIGAKLARPECPVVALAGDGALLMTGLELLTAAQENLGLAVLVLRDRELGQISQFQATALNRKTASELGDYDAGGIAAALGVEALSLERDGDIPAILRRVREITGAGRPVLVDVAIDYSRRTYFTAGVVKTNLLRLPWRDRLRFIGRALKRRIFG